jgi:hypothetical protein
VWLPLAATLAVSTAALARPRSARFDGAGPSTALVAWDDYLRRFPDGQFVPEARFNRAIALLKLHRTADGRAALQPFAARREPSPSAASSRIRIHRRLG